jgi:hypothetical protein
MIPTVVNEQAPVDHRQASRPNLYRLYCSCFSCLASSPSRSHPFSQTRLSPYLGGFFIRKRPQVTQSHGARNLSYGVQIDVEGSVVRLRYCSCSSKRRLPTVSHSAVLSPEASARPGLVASRLAT